MFIKTKNRSLPDGPLKFGAQLKQVHRLVIFFPLATKQARVARYALQRLKNHQGDLEIRLVVNPKVTQYVEWDSGKIWLIPGDGKRMEWNSLRNPIENFRPDLLLQLEPDPPSGLLKLVKQIPTPLKAGLGEVL